MRTVLAGQTELKGIVQVEADAIELVRHAPDWEIIDEPGFSTEELRSRFRELEAAAARRKRRLPAHVDDPLLLEVADRDEYRARPDLPLAISNALVVFSQIPDEDRAHADAARWLAVAVHHRLRAYSLIFASGRRGRTFTVRTRSDRRRDLEAATEALATAFVSRAPYTYEPAPGPTGGEREVGSVFTRFDEVEMKDVLGADVSKGRVIELRNWLSIVRRAYFAMAPVVLNALGAVLTSLSLAFYILSTGHDAWNFLDGLAGRLATAAFGAALIAGTERALELRGRLRDTDGRARYAAIIEWADRA